MKNIYTKEYPKEFLDAIIKDYQNGMRPFELAKKYNKTSGIIITKLQALGVYKKSNYRFTKEDIEVLKQYYPLGDWDYLLKHFNGKTAKQSIINKASKLGIRMESYYWSNDDVEFLKDNYSKMSIKELEKHYNFRYTYGAISAKAEKLELKQSRLWTDSECNILREKYPIISIDEICKLLPNRTRAAIILMAEKLGLRSSEANHWTKEHIEFVDNNWKIMSDEEMALKLNVPVRRIKERRWRSRYIRFNKDFSGYEDLTKFLRGQISEWKIKSLKACNYQCVLTGSKDFEIHHLYNVGYLINKIFDENGFEYKEFEKYSLSELTEIKDAFLKEHSLLGVCVERKLHNKFHQEYGKAYNTPEQWDEFVNNYKKQFV